MAKESKIIGNEPSVFARALKLFMRSEWGGRMSLLCLVQGLTSDYFLTRANQVLFVMEELIRVGKIHFSTMDTTNDEFMNFI